MTGGFDPTVGVTDPTTPAEDHAGASRGRSDLPRGTHVDRYVILKLLGRGGMGAVYAAHDPKLDRQIALKLLHATQHDDSDAAERMVREAQALARLDDPHVVQIYDAGEIDGQIYIAMQLVDGEELASALRRQKPGIAQTLAWFVDAGRGLAAAHAAGLVHRDFKPNNVLIDRRGRIAVTDFGLARDRDGSRGHTGLGVILGTPAYMSPEQHGQQPATEASDQFAFCVSLWEALFGQHPFVKGDRGAMSPFAIGFAIYDGPLIPPPKGSRKVPRRVVEALMRGLARDPAQRWPSMTALLGELAPPEKRRLVPIVVAAGAVAALAGGAAVWLALGGGDHEPPPCSADAAARVDPIWSAAIAQQVHDRFAKTGKSYSDAAARRARTSLDKYASRWRDLASDVCTAERAAHGAAPELVVRRRACLDGRLDAMRTIVGLLASEDNARFVEHAHQMVDGLPDLGACSDADALPASPPPAQAPSIAQLDHELQAAIARGNGGEYEQSKQALAKLAPRADELGWAPLAARVHVAYGERLMLMLDPAARDELAKAGELAMANRMDRDATRAWSDWMIAAGNAHSPDEVATMLPVARASAARTGDRALAVGVDAAYGRGLARSHQLDEAVKVCHTALEEAKSVDQGSQLRNARNCLLESLIPAGRYSEAGPLLAELIDSATKELGPDHPQVSDYLHQRVELLVRSGKLQEARADAEHVLEIRKRAYGEKDYKIVEAMDGLADVLAAQGKPDDARKLYEDAIAMAMTLDPLPLSLLGEMHQALGYILEGQDHRKDALAHFETALKLLREKAGDDSFEVAFLELNYGQMLAETDHEAGVKMLEHARSVLAAKHDRRALAVSGALAVVEAQAKRWPAVKKYAEDALEHADKDESPLNLALLQFDLAEALAETHGDRKRARGLAQQARATFVTLGPRTKANVKQIDQWLAKH